MSGTKRRLWEVRRWLCSHGLHWPGWSDSATPMSYDPPLPPEPGFACDWCGEERLPYRAVLWPVKERLWYLRERLAGRIV
jgi:hypothetical protein